MAHNRDKYETRTVQHERQAAKGATTMPDFDSARRETIRYHDELYSNVELGEKGTWLERPHRLIFDALHLLPNNRPVIAYDLGAGVGRHVVPMLKHLPDGSHVYAIDLLDTAVQQLETLAPTSGTTRLHAHQQDLTSVEFVSDVDLIFAFSAIEHLPSVTAVRQLLTKARISLREGGVIALGVIVDRYEIDSAGKPRPALIESGLSSRDVNEILTDTLHELRPVTTNAGRAEIDEERDGESYTLASTLITYIGRLDREPHRRPR
ncbi:class I SAM-dependent methyltransferase [Microbacterium sp. YY-01]|uniref:class I SAM-dependent methyltransferase n=1 Tax=Microbacterium sp. YY-01 TaxID=3421634 RepID=UPI003D17C9BD